MKGRLLSRLHRDDLNFGDHRRRLSWSCLFLRSRQTQALHDGAQGLRPPKAKHVDGGGENAAEHSDRDEPPDHKCLRPRPSVFQSEPKSLICLTKPLPANNKPEFAKFHLLVQEIACELQPTLI